jgi:hypothetical protein
LGWRLYPLQTTSENPHKKHDVHEITELKMESLAAAAAINNIDNEPILKGSTMRKDAVRANGTAAAAAATGGPSSMMISYFCLLLCIYICKKHPRVCPPL